MAKGNGERLNNLVLVAELTERRLEKQLRERTKELEAALARCDGLAVAMSILQKKFDANCVELKGLNAKNKRLERQLRLRGKAAEAAVGTVDGLKLSMAFFAGGI